MLYLLAQHQNVQEKVYREIMTQLQLYGGDYKYESVKNMKYMHQVFQGT